MTGALRAIILLLFAGGAALLAACSTFERDWDAHVPAQETASGAEGRWSGIWASTASGHSGGLRCILHEDEAGTLHARYRATYARVLTFEYTVPMTLLREGDTYRFSGAADLGWLAGGRYEYEGTVVGDRFESTYRCESDRGVFRMRRVPRESP
jgi:hypothetical protein